MSGPDNTLILVIPGLLGPFPDGSSDTTFPDLPSLQTLLSRSDPTPTPSQATEFERLLFSLFGYHYSATAELPVAALRRLADDLEVDESCYLCSDPVQLVADQDQVYLTASDELAVTVEEAGALADAFNTLYADEGWFIDFSHPQRWYLALNEGPELTTRSPLQSMGYAIQPWLPQGADALQWHAVMNEIQMLFHTHDVNLERDGRGQRLINGLWLWGAGTLPGAVSTRYDKIWSDEPLATGLAIHSSVASDVLPETFDAVLSANNGFVVLDRLRHAVATGNLQRWEKRLGELEQNWFGPLLNRLIAGQLKTLELYPVNGYRYRVTRKSLKRWWKRTRPLDYFCRQSIENP